MIRRRVRCAVFVDFDNLVQIVGAPFGERAHDWLNWFEDGRFDPAGRRKRRLMRKLVYWNQHNDRKWRPYFEAAGFEAFSCPSLVRSKKSEADLRIALDAQRLIYEAPEIEEFAILSTDTDFVPLLIRLAEMDKRTLAAANPGNASYSVYEKHADLVLPIDALREACGYRRPPAFWRRWLGAKTEAQAPEAGALAPFAPRKAPADRTGRLGFLGRGARKPRKPPAAPPPELAQAAAILRDVAEDAPGLPVARRTVERRLAAEMATFRRRGPGAYLGCGSYLGLLRRLAAIEPRLRVHAYGNGGVGVSYRPPVSD